MNLQQFSDELNAMQKSRQNPKIICSHLVTREEYDIVELGYDPSENLISIWLETRKE